MLLIFIFIFLLVMGAIYNVLSDPTTWIIVGIAFIVLITMIIIGIHAEKQDKKSK